MMFEYGWVAGFRLTYYDLKLLLQIWWVGTWVGPPLCCKYSLPGLSVRAGGSSIMPPVVSDAPAMVMYGGKMTVEVNIFQTKVKANQTNCSKLQSYRHVKIGIILHIYQLCLRSTVPPAIGRSAACMEISSQPCLAQVHVYDLNGRLILG